MGGDCGLLSVSILSTDSILTIVSVRRIIYSLDAIYRINTIQGD